MAVTFTRPDSSLTFSLVLFFSSLQHKIRKKMVIKKSGIVFWWCMHYNGGKKFIKCQPNKCCDHSSKWKWIHHVAYMQTKYKVTVARGNVNGWLIQWRSGNVRSRSCLTQSDKCWWSEIRQRSGNRIVLPSIRNNSFGEHIIHKHILYTK